MSWIVPPHIHLLPSSGKTGARRMAAAVGVVLMMRSSRAQGAAPFVKLNAAEIRATLVGMDFTDEIHWAIQHFRDGSVKSFHMGTGDTGRWRFEKDVFCVDYVKAQPECHEVWRSGPALQLRRAHDGSVYLEGILVKHQKRG